MNIEWTGTSFFKHRTNLNMFIYWWPNSNTWILASNEQTSNSKSLLLFRFTKLFIKQTRKSFFRTLNRLESVHLLLNNRTQTPYFWLRTIEHRIWNIVWPITIFYILFWKSWEHCYISMGSRRRRLIELSITPFLIKLGSKITNAHSHLTSYESKLHKTAVQCSKSKYFPSKFCQFLVSHFIWFSYYCLWWT